MPSILIEVILVVAGVGVFIAYYQNRLLPAGGVSSLRGAAIVIGIAIAAALLLTAVRSFAP